jgi:hypothetical protein
MVSMLQPIGKLQPSPLLKEGAPFACERGGRGGDSGACHRPPLSRPSADAEGHPLPQGERAGRVREARLP